MSEGVKKFKHAAHAMANAKISRCIEGSFAELAAGSDFNINIDLGNYYCNFGLGYVATEWFEEFMMELHRRSSGASLFICKEELVHEHHWMVFETVYDRLQHYLHRSAWFTAYLLERIATHWDLVFFDHKKIKVDHHVELVIILRRLDQPRGQLVGIFDRVRNYIEEIKTAAAYGSRDQIQTL